MIIYRIFFAGEGDDDDQPAVTTPVASKEPFNDYNVTKDTTPLLLHYRDPFGLVKFKDSTELPLKKIPHQRLPVTAIKQGINWSFIEYSGYIRNPGSKKLIALVVINGKNETLSVGENKDQVKLIKNLRDSILVSFNGKIKFITLKPSSL